MSGKLSRIFVYYPPSEKLFTAALRIWVQRQRSEEIVESASPAGLRGRPGKSPGWYQKLLDTFAGATGFGGLTGYMGGTTGGCVGRPNGAGRHSELLLSPDGSHSLRSSYLHLYHCCAWPFTHWFWPCFTAKTMARRMLLALISICCFSYWLNYE